jgi:hypothetical protein
VKAKRLGQVRHGRAHSVLTAWPASLPVLLAGPPATHPAAAGACHVLPRPRLARLLLPCPCHCALLPDPVPPLSWSLQLHMPAPLQQQSALQHRRVWLVYHWQGCCCCCPLVLAVASAWGPAEQVSWPGWQAACRLAGSGVHWTARTASSYRQAMRCCGFKNGGGGRAGSTVWNMRNCRGSMSALPLLHQHPTS